MVVRDRKPLKGDVGEQAPKPQVHGRVVMHGCRLSTKIAVILLFPY